MNREKKTTSAIKRMLSGDEAGQQMLFEISDDLLRKTIFTDGSDNTDLEEETSPLDESEKT